MNFVLIVGPPAVGKMTVGKVLAERTGWKLFHNHMSIELVNQFFDFGTKEFRELDQKIRFSVFETVAQSDLTGLIFTLVWAFNEVEDKEYVAEILKVFREVGAIITIVELEASLECRLIRNVQPDRLASKASKRNIERSAQAMRSSEEQYRMTSNNLERSKYSIHKINNTQLTPEQVVDKILRKIQMESKG